MVIANANSNTKSVLFIFLYLISIHIDIITAIVINNINICDDCFPVNGHIPFKILSFPSFLFESSSFLSVSLFCSLTFLIFISICLELNVVISIFCSSLTVFKSFISIFVSVFSSSLLHNSLIFKISSLPLLSFFVNINFPFCSLYSKFSHEFSVLKFSFVTFSNISLSYSSSPVYVYSGSSVLGIFMLISISSPFFIWCLFVFISIALLSSPAYDTILMHVIINMFIIKAIFFILSPFSFEISFNYILYFSRITFKKFQGPDLSVNPS